MDSIILIMSSESTEETEPTYKQLAFAHKDRFPISDQIRAFFLSHSSVPPMIRTAALRHEATKGGTGLTEADFKAISGSHEKLSLADFTCIGTVSTGVFGKIMKVECLRKGAAKGQSLALKVSRVSWSETELTAGTEQVDMECAFWCREALLMQRLDQHPHLITVLGIGFDQKERKLFILMEYFANSTTLNELVKHDGKKISLIRVRNLIHQLISALAHLHSHGIAHRDVKPMNILVLKNADLLKLADFGCAQRLGRSRMASTQIGSVPYSAPEVFETGDYDGPKADAFSVGAVLLDLLSGTIMAIEDREKAIARTLSRHNSSAVLARKKLVFLYQRLTLQKPQSRPSILEIWKNHSQFFPRRSDFFSASSHDMAPLALPLQRSRSTFSIQTFPSGN